MESFLLIGLLIGMRHAVEADHVAAVASLVSGKQSLAQTIKQGSVWGLGHTITLFLFGSIVLSLDSVIPENFVMGLEMAVGFMLVLLGADVLYRLIKNKIHFHSHQHNDGIHHFHAHSHKGDVSPSHAVSAHQHQHVQGFPIRALMVGMMHGMAGSAAVIVLVMGSVSSLQQGLLYILFFGIGSIVGMALLSIIISIPMRLSSPKLSRLHNAFQTIIGVVTIALGVYVVSENSGLFFI